jgi:hypothetical protein
MGTPEVDLEDFAPVLEGADTIPGDEQLAEGGIIVDWAR